MLKIVPLTQEHAVGWRSLWRMDVGDALHKSAIDHTEKQLLDPRVPLFALLGLSQENEVVGLLHGVVHPVAGSLHPVCYMQDMFVHPARRRQGIATNLLDALAAMGRIEKWDRIYWLADKNNAQANSFYKDRAVPLDFSFHILPLGMLDKIGVDQ